MSRIFPNKLRIYLLASLILAIITLLYLAILPSGSAEYIFIPGEKNSFWGRLSPVTRMGVVHSDSQEIIGDPAYINLRTSRPFKEAELVISYKHSDSKNINIIEAGVLADKSKWRYQLHPVNNIFINKLSSEWFKIQKGNTILLQKSKKFSTISDFIANPPQSSKIAVYNYDLESKYTPKQSSANKTTKTLNYKIRGPYEFYTYAHNEEALNFDFEFTSLNQFEEKNPTEVFLYYKGKIISSYSIIESDNNDNKKKPSHITIDLKDMPEGVYKIEVKTSNNTLTNAITHTQSHLSFINKLWIHKSPQENFQIFSDSDNVSFITRNPESIQSVFLNNSKLDINETYKQFNQKTKSNPARILLQKDDIEIAGNGVFAFNKDQLINPTFEKVDVNFDLSNSKIEYIIANYKIPSQKAGWTESKINIDISRAYRENNTYSFMISIPGLKADDDIKDSLQIHQIKVKLKGDNIKDLAIRSMNKVKKYFKQ